MVPSLGMTGAGPRVMVREDDLETAIEVLSAAEDADEAAREDDDA